jgi:hypothetical protein
VKASGEMLRDQLNTIPSHSADPIAIKMTAAEEKAALRPMQTVM